MRRPAALRALHQDPRLREALLAAAAPLPEPLARWLGRLALLEGLPFAYLVPDPRMLPEESARFFHVDQNWLDALLDGALSVVASFDAHHAATLDLFGPHVRGRARAEATLERRRRRLLARGRGEGPQPAPLQPPIWSGFLLRSAAVAAWPGLVVRAFGSPAGGEALPLLRLDRPGPGLLLALFGGTARRVDVAVPPQSLRFGVERGPDHHPRLAVRGLGGKIPAGKQLGGVYVQAAERPSRAGRRVLDLAATRARLAQALAAAYAPDPAPPLDPGATALELVAGSERQSFYNGPPPPRSPSCPDGHQVMRPRGAGR